MFSSSVPVQLRVTSVSPADSVSFSNNFVMYQLANLDPGATVIIKIETVAQVSSSPVSVIVPGSVTGIQSGTVVRADANSDIVTIVPAGGLPVTGSDAAPVFMGLGLLAMAFIGTRFTNRLRRLRRRRR